jgi:hypothetical protein
MYSITENIYYSQLYSVVLFLRPESVSHRIIQGKDWVLSLHVLSSCGLPFPPTCLLVTVNEARSYFASTIQCSRSRVSSGSIVSDYGLNDRAIGVRSPAGAKDLSSILCVQTGSEAHPASCTMGTGVLSPGVKARPVRDADHSPPSSAEVVNK